MINWLKEKLGIAALKRDNETLKAQLARHKQFVADKVSELKEYTRVDADIGYRGNNTIVLTGVYRRKAFVRFYDIGDGEFERLVEQLRHMKDHALVRHLDKPPSFSGHFDI